MRIKIEFDRDLTIDEVKEYLSDMNNERYEELDYDKQLELAACAYIYCVWHETNPNEMLNEAECDVAEGIEEFFFSEMCHNYIDAYKEEIRETVRCKNDGSEE